MGRGRGGLHTQSSLEVSCDDMDGYQAVSIGSVARSRRDEKQSDHQSPEGFNSHFIYHISIPGTE